MFSHGYQNYFGRETSTLQRRQTHYAMYRASNVWCVNKKLSLPVIVRKRIGELLFKLFSLCCYMFENIVNVIRVTIGIFREVLNFIILIVFHNFGNFVHVT